MRSDNVSRLLGTALVLSVPAGQAFHIVWGAERLPILWVEFFGVTLVCHLVLSRRLVPRYIGPIIIAGSCLLLAGLLGPNPLLTLVTTKNLVVGAILGTILARHLQPKRSATLLLMVIVYTVVQLVLLRGDLQLSGSFHSAANLGWGRSNYIAAVVLLAAGVIGVSRPKALRSVPPLLLALAVVYLTGSRGSLFALVVGLFVFAVVGGIGGTILQRGVRSIVICVLAVLVIGMGSALLTSRNIATNAGANVAARPALVRASISEFFESPVVGSGTGGLSSQEIMGVGAGQRYAHSVVPSLLQQYGLLGVPWIALMVKHSVRAWRQGLRVARPWLAVMVVVASVEVVFEGVVGSMIGWWLIGAAQVRWPNMHGHSEYTSREHPIASGVGPLRSGGGIRSSHSL